MSGRMEGVSEGGILPPSELISLQHTALKAILAFVAGGELQAHRLAVVADHKLRLSVDGKSSVMGKQCRHSKRKSTRTRVSMENDNKADGKRTRAESPETDSESQERTRAESPETDSESEKRTQAETDSEICGLRRSERIKESRGRFAGTSSGNSPRSEAALHGYSIIAMPEDGNCLFHSIGHASRLRQGMDPPTNVRAQRRLAAELRNLAMDELVKQREFMAPYIAGDFDEYVEKMRKSKEWAGARELLMLSSVLQMPITVYTFTCTSTETGPLIVTAEYGQEHMSEATDQPPIQVLFYTQRKHYDVVQFHADHLQSPAQETRPSTSKFDKSATL